MGVVIKYHRAMKVVRRSVDCGCGQGWAAFGEGAGARAIDQIAFIIAAMAMNGDIERRSDTEFHHFLLFAYFYRELYLGLRAEAGKVLIKCGGIVIIA